MAEIEKGLHDVHAAARARKQMDNSSQLGSAGTVNDKKADNNTSNHETRNEVKQLCMKSVCEPFFTKCVLF